MTEDAWARATSAERLGGPDIRLVIARQKMVIDGWSSDAIGINGTVPAPLLRLKQGTVVRFTVVNELDESSSIHWHGLLVPADMDGVPGVSFPGIAPRSTFVYEFPIRQAGTYWYHSHSGLQEQLGHYGPIVNDPEGPEQVAYDREQVIVLSDHSAMMPHSIMRKLKQEPDYFDYPRQALDGLGAGHDQPLKERLRWGGMRMSPTDISDVTGVAYTYLVNGHGPKDNWTALFSAGERVRLRLINASAMTSFKVRIPGLPMTVVQADGQYVQPIETDEIQIAVAETYDVIVTPDGSRAYTLVGEAIDRSGMARAGIWAWTALLSHRQLTDDYGSDIEKHDARTGRAVRHAVALAVGLDDPSCPSSSGEPGWAEGWRHPASCASMSTILAARCATTLGPKDTVSERRLSVVLFRHRQRRGCAAPNARTDLRRFTRGCGRRDGVREEGQPVGGRGARQYSGTAGRVENSQIRVFLAYCSSHRRGHLAGPSANAGLARYQPLSGGVGSDETPTGTAFPCRWSSTRRSSTASAWRRVSATGMSATNRRMSRARRRSAASPRSSALAWSRYARRIESWRA